MVRKVAAMFLLLAPLALAGAAEGDAAKLKAAKENVARVKKELERAWLDLKADFDLVRSAKWHRVSRPLREVIQKYMDPLRERAEEVSPEFRGAVSSTGLLSKKGALRLADRMIERIGRLGRGESISPGDLLSYAVAKVFPEETFEDCWDKAFEDLDVVRRFRDANRELSALTKALAESATGKGNAGKGPPGMVLIPAGRYTVGPWTGWDFDLKKNRAERVRIAAFYMDVTEVTNETYLRFLESLTKKKVAECLAYGFTVDAEGKIRMPEGQGRYPARGMTFPAAAACAKFLGKRLPTEFEWEAAARGRKGRGYPWGDVFDKALTNSSESGRKGPVPVGTVEGDVTPEGVRDLGGNVSELTCTLQGGQRAKGRLGTDDAVVYRGGNYEEDHESTATTYRWTLRALGQKEPKVGFRCVISAKDWRK